MTVADDKKYRISGWVSEDTYSLMEEVKKEYREEKGLKLSQGMLVDLAFKELEKSRKNSN